MRRYSSESKLALSGSAGLADTGVIESFELSGETTGESDINSDKSMPSFGFGSGSGSGLEAGTGSAVDVSRLLSASCEEPATADWSDSLLASSSFFGINTGSATFSLESNFPGLRGEFCIASVLVCSEEYFFGEV